MLAPVRGIALLLPLVAIVLPFVFVGFIIFIVTRKERKQQETGADETRMMQEIYHRLTEFENRIESLETLLIERDRKEVTDDAPRRN